MDASRSRRLILSIQALVKLQHQWHLELSKAGRSDTRQLATTDTCVPARITAHLKKHLLTSVTTWHKECKTLLYEHQYRVATLFYLDLTKRGTVLRSYYAPYTAKLFCWIWLSLETMGNKCNSFCFYGCKVDLHTLVIRDCQQNKQIISKNF